MKLSVHLSDKSAPSADVLGIGVFDGGSDPAAGVERPVREAVKKAVSEKRFGGKDGETLVLESPVKTAEHLVLIGLGKPEKMTLQKARLAAARTLSHAKTLKRKSASVVLESFVGRDGDRAQTAGAVVEGLRLADYHFDLYKSKPSKKGAVETFTILAGSAEARSVQKAVRDAEIVMESLYFTRDLANEPPNVATSLEIARRTRAMAAKAGLTCRILGKKEITSLKMGGLLGVAQGSVYPPQFIILENKVTGAAAKEAPLVLVGKGITFDTGGISIKPAGNMDHMKFDMCGAAAVIGAMRAIALLKLNVKVVGITPVCENMVGSGAQRPGDIVKISNGKTVEVLNTDAEGRLILADALSYAERLKPRAMVDIATLTGACAVTFGDLASGLMSTDPDLAKRLRDIGDRTGERLWEMPLWDEYADWIKATYADIQNISKKSAGIITAGKFLQEFAGHTKAWAHLDVAGTAWNDGGPKPLSPIGATGMGVRLFVELAKSYAR